MKSKKIPYLILLCMVSFLLFSVPTAEAVRLKDISSVKGVRDNQLFGYGIITGLMGTGDGNNSVQFMIKSMIGMLQRMGINTPAADVNNLKMKNVAAVMVTAVLPPFAKTGSKIDIQVSSIGDAKSLKGGVLLIAPLKAANGEVYAVAQGPLTIGGEKTARLTTARIPNGAIVEREIPSKFFNRENITFLLDNPDFSTSAAITKKINATVGQEIAHPLDSSTIFVTVPEEYQKNVVTFVSQVENIDVQTSMTAKVIVDEQTGTVVISDSVRISPIAVSHGDITLVVRASKPDETVDTAGVFTVLQESERHAVFMIDSRQDVQGIAKGLNAVGASPQDIIAIFQAIQASGALQGDLQVL